MGYRHYTSRDGSNRRFQAPLKTEKATFGLLPTEVLHGLDGYAFRNYTTIDGLPHNNVLLINQDHKGRMWFLTSNGAFSYMIKDSIVAYEGNASIKKLIRNVHLIFSMKEILYG